MLQVVRLINKGREPFRDMYANQPYVVPGGESQMIPWDAACLWFGDPTFVDDTDRNILRRTEEVHRVLTRMSIHTWQEGADPTSETTRTMLPKVVIEDLEGNEVQMAVFDPEGRDVTPTVLTHGQQDALQSEIDLLRQKYDQLLQTLSERGQGTLDQLPEDVPQGHLPDDVPLGPPPPPKPSFSQLPKDTPTKVPAP